MALELEYLALGITMGLGASILPGPLMALLVSETIRHGKVAGLKVAMAPLVTDSIIVVASYYFLTLVSSLTPVLGVISILGALFLAYLAYENLTLREIRFDLKTTGMDSLHKGIITNFLNPHPYLFFFLVGGPIILCALKTSQMSAIGFVAGFLVFFVGMQVALVFLIDKYKSALGGRVHLYAVKFIGLALLVFSLEFFLKGIRLIGIILPDRLF